MPWCSVSFLCSGAGLLGHAIHSGTLGAFTLVPGHRLVILDCYLCFARKQRDCFAFWFLFLCLYGKFPSPLAIYRRMSLGICNLFAFKSDFVNPFKNPRFFHALKLPVIQLFLIFHSLFVDIYASFYLFLSSSNFFFLCLFFLI